MNTSIKDIKSKYKMLKKKKEIYGLTSSKMGVELVDECGIISGVEARGGRTKQAKISRARAGWHQSIPWTP